MKLTHCYYILRVFMLISLKYRNTRPTANEMLKTHILVPLKAKRKL